MLHWLPLRLVECHSKPKSNWKLSSGKFECNLILSRLVWDPWDEHLPPSKVPSKQLDLQHPAPQSCHYSSAPIANPMCSLQVPQHHNGTSLLQLQLRQWKPRVADGIQVLHRIVEHHILLTTLLRCGNWICTVEYLRFPRELFEHLSIQAIHLSI